MEDQEVKSTILEEMQLCRNYCSLIHKARQKSGFISIKYPLTDVKLNHYFTPEYRELIADECNIVGYMDIPPVEYEWKKPYKKVIKKGFLYKILNFFGKYPYRKIPNPFYDIYDDGIKWVAISNVRSDWQQKLCDDRSDKRRLAEKRKNG